MTRRIFDISPPLTNSIPVWPGDTAFDFHANWVMEGDCPVNVGTFTASVHTGAHADAPIHYAKDGKGIDAVDVARYIGPAWVVDARAAKAVIVPDDFAAQIPNKVERVLFRTYDKVPVDQWDSEFVAIHPSTIEYLAERGCILVGIDTPSVDPETSKTLDAHKAIHRLDLSILEGLVLDDIPCGEYELIAPPLKIVGGDASPVRALLREF